MRKYGTIIGLVVAAGLITISLLMQQNLDVFIKAIRICLECVGIG